MSLGLRIDVDTHEGMRDGVPRLLNLLDAVRARASFFLAMGPDRSGIAILNAFRPGFLRKMHRNHALRIYGLRTVLSGTLLPSRPVASAFPKIVAEILDRGHELGVHGWDHRLWQDRLLRMTTIRVAEQLDRAFAAHRKLTGRAAVAAAAPAWLTRDDALIHQEKAGLRYASDCRGREPFLPIVGKTVLATAQLPATTPTLDEALSSPGQGSRAFFREIEKLAATRPWQVFTLHAEFEGGPYLPEFLEFLENLASNGVPAVPLGELLAQRLEKGALPTHRLVTQSLSGRHGVVSWQEESTPTPAPASVPSGAMS